MATALCWLPRGNLADLTLTGKTHERVVPRLVWAVPPILLAVYPSLSLLAANLREAPLADAVRPAIASAALRLVAFLGALLLLRRSWKACLVSWVAVLIFFSYGPIYGLLKSVELSGMPLGRHRLLLLALTGAFAFLVWRVHRTPSPGRRVLRLLTIVSLAAVLPSSVSIGLSALRTSLPGPSPSPSASDLVLHVTSPEARPDVYFIILDAHAREDVLRDYFGDEEYAFPETLRAMGFVVADDARSNYLRTVLSVPATLNMEFLDELPVDLRNRDYQDGLADAISHSRVRTLLEGIGYSTYAVASSYLPTEIVDADHYLTPQMRGLDEVEAYWAFSDFEELLVRQSVLVALLDLQFQQRASAAFFLANGLENARGIRRDIVLSALRNLEDAARIPGPKLFFAHIVSPHYPYLFGSLGEPTPYSTAPASEEAIVRPDRQTWDRYRDQMDFIDREIARVVHEILVTSAIEPVILIQADHGPDTGIDLAHPESISMHHRTAILSAAYLPVACRKNYYPTITSVNTFRVVLNCLFDAGLPMKADQSFLDDETRDGLSLYPLDTTWLQNNPEAP